MTSQQTIVTGTNPAREAANTVTLSNAIMVIAKATMGLNSDGISGAINGESLTMTALCGMAAQRLKENIIAESCQ